MPDTLTAHISRVVDGDTVVIRGSGGDTRKVRLWGIDAPETGQPYGPAATKAARQLVGDEQVTVRVKDIDPYNRIVGRVERKDGVDLGQSLVRSGYAWHGRKYPTSEALQVLEEYARKKGNGLWDQDDPTPPWRWRNGAGRTERTLRGLGQLLLWFLGALVLLALLVSLSA